MIHGRNAASREAGEADARPSTRWNRNRTKMRFSVLIPVYNREEYVRQAIESVLSQAFSDYELIVIDDGSTDRTLDVLRSYGARIKTIHQDNRGGLAARNVGSAQAEGEYLAFLDSDDLFLSGALATYDRVIRAFDSPAIILGSMTYFNQPRFVQRNPGHGENAIEVLAYKDFLAKDIGLGMSNSKIVMRKSVFELVRARQIGALAVFDHMDDHDLLLRAGTSGPCVIVVGPTTVAYRVHGSNTVQNIEAMVGGTLSLVRAERCGQYPGGKARSFSRYAYIGSKVYFWIKKALKLRRPDLAFRLLRNAGPMVAAAALRKAWGKLRPTTRSHVLGEET
ncbi:MAG: glycosyltransferase family A protein [Candidatus Aureabacteria bacterium]|nr:glycosyltransferase family A protein [Candidatus Auribacterota bacterium]